MPATLPGAVEPGVRHAAPSTLDRAFQEALVAVLPKLRGHALSLTRNRAEADDLVHDAVALALRGHHRFELGTDFAAWSHSILRNRYLSEARQRRRQAELDGEAVEAMGAAGPLHDDRLVLKELAALLKRLPPKLREPLLLVVVQGLSYEEVAAAQGCAADTAKSRVFRARHLLRLWLMGGPAAAATPVEAADARAAAPSRAVAP